MKNLNKYYLNFKPFYLIYLLNILNKKLLLSIMREKFCFIGLILVSNTYTYFLTKIYIYRNYLLIPNNDIPKNMYNIKKL